MSNKELIKSFIDKLMLKYKENEVVSRLVEELSALDEFSVHNENGVIKCVYNNGDNEVLFDEMNKTITFINKSEAIYEEKTISITNESKYIEDDKGFHVDTKKVTNEKSSVNTDKGTYVITNTIFESSSLVDNVQIMVNDTTKRIEGYKNDKHVFTSASNNYKKYKSSHDRLTLLDSNSNKKDVYLLANGDALKVENNNGLEEYYYCDSGQIDEKDKNDESKAEFNVKITYSDFSNIISNIDNNIAAIGFDNTKIR